MSEKEKILHALTSATERFGRRSRFLITRSRKYSFYRLAIFGGTVLITLIFFFFFSEMSALIAFVAGIAIFGLIAAVHNKINHSIKKNNLWIKIKERQSARIKIDWQKIPEQDTELPDSAHPFEADLSITGKYSLHRLTDNCVSREGSALLKDWLTTEKPDPYAIISRQNLVKELRIFPRFRDKLVLYSLLVSPKKLNSRSFLGWLSRGSSIDRLKRLTTAGWVLVVFNFLLLALFIFALIPPYFSLTLLVYFGLYFFNLNLVRDSFENAMHIEGELGKFYSVFHFLEAYNYKKESLLFRFCSPLINPATGPKRHFRRISQLIIVLSFQKNPITALILNLIMPWDFFFTLKLEQEKKTLAAGLNEWLDRLHSLEALSSLAGFAYLNPEYCFPELKKDEKMFLEITEAGHPLIPYNKNVMNSITLDPSGEIIIITGSNMSGKSTFLKTIGTNLALAYAGAPVNAKRFNTGLFRLFTCIKIEDSVTDGISYFYAEVKRLKELLNKLNEISDFPLLFLIDEIFRGTNNLERLIGSRSYIKTLSRKHGTGIISTHDLELVKLEDEIQAVRNFHFREEAVAGRMVFDYKLRQGPSPTTNALKIMQMEGLPVD